MSNENTCVEANKSELNDDELAEITGGLDFLENKAGGNYYMWTGGDSQADSKYLCPRCGRPVHYGSGWRYYCDPCDCSWFYEDKLVPNVSSGLWKEISTSTYAQLTKPGTH